MLSRSQRRDARMSAHALVPGSLLVDVGGTSGTMSVGRERAARPGL